MLKSTLAIAITLCCSACSQDSLGVGPTNKLPVPVALTGLSTTLTPKAVWFPYTAGRRWPNVPTDVRTGTAQCRDCDPATEAFYMQFHGDQRVQVGVGICLEVIGYHGDEHFWVTLRHSEGDRIVETVSGPDVLSAPCFRLPWEGDYHVSAWRDNGTSAPGFGNHLDHVYP